MCTKLSPIPIFEETSTHNRYFNVFVFMFFIEITKGTIEFHDL